MLSRPLFVISISNTDLRKICLHILYINEPGLIDPMLDAMPKIKLFKGWRESRTILDQGWLVEYQHATIPIRTVAPSVVTRDATMGIGSSAEQDALVDDATKNCSHTSQPLHFGEYIAQCFTKRSPA